MVVFAPIHPPLTAMALRLVVMLLMASWAPAGAQPLDDALAALGRGDAASAMKILRPLAAQGHATAQFHLGAMYDNGRGVTRDHAQALNWYRLAAVQAHADAQRQLGELYYDGLGVAQDHVRAYLWLHLAAMSGDARAVKYRDLVAKRLKPPQITQAQNLARECQKKKFAGCE